jgi:hypothetical protein
LHGRRQSSHRFFERRVGVEAVRIEDVDVLEAHALQALVEARQNVFATAASLAVGAGPHVPAGLRRDDELVPVGHEILFEDLAEVGLGAAERRAVVVGEVEVRDAEIEGGAKHVALRRQGRVVAEVVPEAEREKRKLEPALAALAISHRFVTL